MSLYCISVVFRCMIYLGEVEYKLLDDAAVIIFLFLMSLMLWLGKKIVSLTGGVHRSVSE